MCKRLVPKSGMVLGPVPGTGSELHVYRLEDATLWWRGRILAAGIRIHGLQAVECSPGVLIGIHGDRYAQVEGPTSLGHTAPSPEDYLI